MTNAELRLECLAVNREMWKCGVAPLSFGSASVCDRAAGHVAIKPVGVPYATMTADQMVVVDMESKVLAGSLPPAKDLQTHLRLYEAFPSIGAVVHSHSKFATVWSQAMHPIPCVGTTHARYFPDEIPVTRALTEFEVRGNYERAVGDVIVERFRELDPERQPAVLVAAHGPIVWGANGTQAMETAVVLEMIAEMAAWTLALTSDCPSLPAYLREKHFAAANPHGHPTPTEGFDLHR
jgi:L-ribulose-5-phosphate 4-epimerase